LGRNPIVLWKQGNGASTAEKGPLRRVGTQKKTDSRQGKYVRLDREKMRWKVH